MNKRLIHGLFAAVLVVGSISAQTHHDKTFLMPRSHNSNLAMEYTTWNKQVSIFDDKQWRMDFQAVGFYQESLNKEALGKYFGIYNFQTDRLEDFIGVSKNSSLQVESGGDNNLNFDPSFALHPLDVLHHAGASYYASDNYKHLYPLLDKIKLRPSQESYGVSIDYYQKLDKVVKGLFFKVSAPLVNVKNTLGLSHLCTASHQSLPIGTKDADIGGGTKVTFIDYLMGKVSNNDKNNKQSCLTRAKFHNGKDSTGIADVQLALGYNFLYKPTKHVNASVLLTIPTGDIADGEFLFEPIVGNGGHWALGFGMDSRFELWKDDDITIDVIAAGELRYLFQNTQKRLVPYKTSFEACVACPKSRWGQYSLALTHGTNCLFPAANVLTQDVEVEPRVTFNAMYAMALNWKDFTFDLGSELFFKAAERLSIKHWVDYKHAIAHWEVDVVNGGVPFDIVTNYAEGSSNESTVAHRQLNRNRLMPEHAGTPTQITYKTFAGIGYTFKDWKYPVLLGLGGSYEMPANNSALETWALWFKLGVTY